MNYPKVVVENIVIVQDVIESKGFYNSSSEELPWSPILKYLKIFLKGDS